MTDIIKNYLTKIQIGAEQSFKNLSVFPLLSDYISLFDYLTIDEAISKNLVEIVKIKQNGSAPKTKLINKSDQFVMILYGDKRTHAKQYWIGGTTILIPANESVIVPTSFVQKDHSSYKCNRFHGPDHVKPSRDYLEHFARVDYQIGALFMINGKVAGMEGFGRHQFFETTFMKMIEIYAEIAVDRFDRQINQRSSKTEAINFLDMAKDSRVQKKLPASSGSGYRLQSERCTGFALAHEDQVLHLSVAAKY